MAVPGPKKVARFRRFCPYKVYKIRSHYLPLDVGDHLALRWHVSRTVGQPELGLESVEVGLQLGLMTKKFTLESFNFER